jgi:hypothetical protein
MLSLITTATLLPQLSWPAQQPLLQFLAQIRKTLNKLCYQAERTEAAALETRQAASTVSS